MDGSKIEKGSEENDIQEQMVEGSRFAILAVVLYCLLFAFLVCSCYSLLSARKLEVELNGTGIYPLHLFNGSFDFRRYNVYNRTIQ